jgi:hypothetical protein
MLFLLLPGVFIIFKVLPMVPYSIIQYYLKACITFKELATCQEMPAIL